jgi:hypothetical protein
MTMPAITATRPRAGGFLLADLLSACVHLVLELTLTLLKTAAGPSFRSLRDLLTFSTCLRVFFLELSP